MFFSPLSLSLVLSYLPAPILSPLTEIKRKNYLRVLKIDKKNFALIFPNTRLTPAFWWTKDIARLRGDYINSRWLYQ